MGWKLLASFGTAQALYSQTPILIATAHGDEKLKTEARNLELGGFLHKPVLYELCEQILNRLVLSQPPTGYFFENQERPPFVGCVVVNLFNPYPPFFKGGFLLSFYGDIFTEFRHFLISHLNYIPHRAILFCEVSEMKCVKMVRPDSKGRITLGRWAEGVSGFLIKKDKDDRIILEPYTEIPAREKWLFDNKAALKKVAQGIKDAASQQVHEKGSFAKYVDEDDID